MHSTLDGRNDPHDVLEIAPDVVLVARAAAEFPSLAPDATHRPLDRQPNMGSGSPAGEAIPRVDTSFRATDTSGGRSHGAWARRAAMVFLFALGSAFAAAAWERYGDDAQASVAGITPQIIPALMSWLPLQKPATAAQADTAPVTRNAASTDQTAPTIAAQPADSAIAATPAAAASSAPDQAEVLQSMARDVANLTQQVSELQASIVQLKANQEQMARDKAKAPEARVSEVRPAAAGRAASHQARRAASAARDARAPVKAANLSAGPDRLRASAAVDRCARADRPAAAGCGTAGWRSGGTSADAGAVRA